MFGTRLYTGLSLFPAIKCIFFLLIKSKLLLELYFAKAYNPTTLVSCVCSSHVISCEHDSTDQKSGLHTTKLFGNSNSELFPLFCVSIVLAMNFFPSWLLIYNRGMAGRTSGVSLVAECLDCTLHSLISGEFSSVEGKSCSLNLS